MTNTEPIAPPAVIRERVRMLLDELIGNGLMSAGEADPTLQSVVVVNKEGFADAFTADRVAVDADGTLVLRSGDEPIAVFAPGAWLSWRRSDASSS
jgi:hypothetical protein